MIEFEKLNAKSIADLYRNKKEAEIEVSTEITGFGQENRGRKQGSGLAIMHLC